MKETEVRNDLCYHLDDILGIHIYDRYFTVKHELRDKYTYLTSNTGCKFRNPRLMQNSMQMLIIRFGKMKLCLGPLLVLTLIEVGFLI